MKLVGGLAVAVSVFAAGCSSGSQYFNDGIGTELAYAGLPAQTSLQNLYVQHICQQAGSFSGTCSIDWNTFVQAGLNDIDQRCDAYLAWLDTRRRSTGPVLQQIGDTQNVTQAIMVISSVGISAIGVVGAAFGFARNTFNNINSRLVLEVNHSTVQSIVMNGQTRFRNELHDKRISTRPQAIFALRQYLRICMPFTIENEINTTITTFERGGARALEESNRASLISIASIGDAKVGPPREFTANKPLPVDPWIATPVQAAVTSWEKNIQLVDLAKIQDYLCVETSNAFGPQTRAGILMRALKDGVPKADNLLNSREGAILISEARTHGACTKSKFSNIFERLVFLTPADEVSFYKQLAGALAEGDPVTGTETLADARPLIVRYYEKNKGFIVEGTATTEVTPRMYKRIISTQIAP